MKRRLVALLALIATLWMPASASAASPAADALAVGYAALGGRATLGPILGPAFRRGDESFLYLPTGRAVLQVPIDGGAAVPANAMEWFTAAGMDGWLETVRGVPRPFVDPQEDLRGPMPFADELALRRGWLRQPEIAAAYDAYGDRALLLLGLPTSLPERHGPFIAQRFQRGALQLWIDTVPGAPEPGTIVPVNAGELLAEAGLLPPTPSPRLPASVAPGEVLTRAPNTGNAVAITFDMGSIDDGLPAVLEALASRGLRATFFVTGDFVRRYEWALPRLIELGHEIANHTVTHSDLTTLAGPSALREVDHLDAMLAARGAPPPIWFRPPFGAYDRRVQSLLASRGYPLVMWRLDLADWRQDIGIGDVIRIGRRILPGDVVVTHGGLPKTAAAIPIVLDELAARGLRQVTLSELYGPTVPP